MEGRKLPACTPSTACLFRWRAGVATRRSSKHLEEGISGLRITIPDSQMGQGHSPLAHLVLRLGGYLLTETVLKNSVDVGFGMNPET